MKRKHLVYGLLATSLILGVDAYSQGFLNKLKNKAKEIKQSVENVTTQENKTESESSDSGSESDTDSAPKSSIYRSVPEGKIDLDFELKTTLRTKTIALKTGRATVTDFHDGMAIVRDGDDIFFINRTGDKITPEEPIAMPRGKDGASARFENGHIPVKLIKGGCVIMDKQGAIVKRLPREATGVAGFLNGVGVYITNTTAKAGTNFGTRQHIRHYIDTNGNDIWPSLSVPTVDANVTDPATTLKPVSEGLRAVRKYNPTIETDVWGYVDEKGVVKIAPNYGDAAEFSDGMAAVQEQKSSYQKGKWGYIDKTGKLVIDYIFLRKPGRFIGGKALVATSGGDPVIIDKRGEVVFEVPNGWKITDFDNKGRALYWGSEDNGHQYEHVAYCISGLPDNKTSFVLFKDTPILSYDPGSDMFYYNEMKGCMPIDVETMTSLPTAARRTFSEGLGILDDGIVNTNGVYIVKFKANRF